MAHAGTSRTSSISTGMGMGSGSISSRRAASGLRRGIGSRRRGRPQGWTRANSLPLPLLLLLLLIGPSCTFKFSFGAVPPTQHHHLTGGAAVPPPPAAPPTATTAGGTAAAAAATKAVPPAGAPSSSSSGAATAGDGRMEVYNSISRGGFFSQKWDVHQSKAKMRVRQVPGDGSCLFHAIYVALAHATNGSHPSEDYDQMCKAAGVLRQTALDFLQQDPDRVLSVTYNQDMRSAELLEMTSKEMGLTADQYLVRLRDPKEWGGGLEIVALANALQRPIFLYELKPVGILFWSKFVFKKMVECGMPKFSPNKCLHILIADCNFPDCAPYFYNKAGNHFLALFPDEDVPADYHLDSSTGEANPRTQGAKGLSSPGGTPAPAAPGAGPDFGRRVSLRGRVLRRLQEKLMASLFRVRGDGDGGQRRQRGGGERRRGGGPRQ